MQVVLGTLVTVLVLELFSTGNGANIQDQNRGYIIDLPSQMTVGRGSWSGNDNYKRQVSDTKNDLTKPVYIFPAIKYRPNYFVQNDKQSNVNMGLPREHYSKYDPVQINRHSSLLVALRPSYVMAPNLDLNANKYEKPYPHQFLQHNRTQPQLPAVYYHPQSIGYHTTPRRSGYQIDQIPVTGYNTPLPGHIKPLLAQRQPSSDNYLPSPLPQGYHPPNYRQPQRHGPRSPPYKGAASFPHPGIIPQRVYRKVGTSLHPVAAPPSSSHPVLAPSSPYSEVAPPPHPGVVPPISHLGVPPSPHSSVTQPSQQHVARGRLLPHPGVAQPPPPHPGVALPHQGVVLPPPPPRETPGSLLGVVTHSIIAPSSPHLEWTSSHLREAPPPHLGMAPPPRHIDVAPPPPPHADVTPLSQLIAVQPPLPHSDVAPPQHLKAVLPPPPHSGVAPPPHLKAVLPPPPHSDVAPPQHLKAVLPPPPLPHSRLPSLRPQQTREAPPLSHPGVAAPQYLGVDRSPSHLRGVAPPTHSSYLKKIEYNTDSNAANYIYRNVPTFWKSHFPLNKVKRSIGDGEDYLHDLEFEELEYEDAENDDSESYIDDHTHSQDVNGHDSHADNDHDSNNNHNHDSTDNYKRKKRWASDNSQNNGDCQDCEMSNESGEEDGYNVDPWNNGDSGESSQTDTWNNDDNNDDYTWNNDDDYTWNNDGNNDDYTWNNDYNVDDVWNNDYESDDGETDTDDVPKPHPLPPQPGPIRQPAYPRRPPPPRRESQRPIPRPNPHAPKRHRPQAWPGSGPSENIHPRPNPRPSRPARQHGPQPQTHNYPSHQLPIPPAPPRHPKSPPYPSERLQYDWYYEDC